MTNLQNNKTKVLIAYCYNKPFGPYSLPVKFQNILCENYTRKLNLIFGPGIGEPIFSKNFFALKSMIKDSKKNSGIVMLSLYMLPAVKKKRLEIFNLALNSYTELHFVFENISLKNKKDISKIESIFFFKKFTKKSRSVFNNLKK